MREARLWFLGILLIVFTLSASAQTVSPRGGSISPVDNSNAFVHKTAVENTSFNTSILVSETDGSTPLLSNNPNAIVFLTRNVTQSTAYHAQPYGVYFNGSTWDVFNQNASNFMPVGVGFNVQVMGKGNTVFAHTTTLTNTSGHITTLDHPLLNGDSDASEIVIVTPNWTETYNPKEIGVYYDSSQGKWTIFNQDISAMPIGAVFNVQVVRDANTGFKQLATVANIVSTSKTEIDNIFLNNNNNAQFIITQNWSLAGIYNNEAIGVEYDNASNRWRIINIDGSAMPVNAGFNVLVSQDGDDYGDGVLINGGFEVPLTTKATAIKWNTINAGAGSKRVCNKYAPAAPVDKQLTIMGECAYVLKGAAGQVRKIVQKVNIPLAISPYTVIDIVARLKGVNAAGVRIKCVVRLSDGQQISYSIAGSLMKGTYDWDSFSAYTLFDPANPPVKLRLAISIGGGALYIDGLSSAMF